MSTAPDVRTETRATPPARYLACRPASESTPSFFCMGERVDEMRLYLERAHEPGRYRVFDRRPDSRGIDSELIGEFVVDDAGHVLWKALSSLSE
jgi:hypothetical protein